MDILHLFSQPPDFELLFCVGLFFGSAQAGERGDMACLRNRKKEYTDLGTDGGYR